MKKIKWGIIGVGDVCEVKSAPAMNVIADSELVAVMRRNADKARDYASRHRVLRSYSNVDDLLAEPLINAVYIATPPSSHAELTQMAARAGYPVYVEKPMARTYEECKLMIDVCKKYNVPLFVAYYRRYLPNYQFIKQVIDEGRLGEIRSYSIALFRPPNPNLDEDRMNNWRVNKDIAGDGYFYDLASHQLDFMDYLFGEITQAHGIKANQAQLYETSDLVTGVMKHHSGVIGSGVWCFSASKQACKDVTIITGSKGYLSFPTYNASFVDVHEDGASLIRHEFDHPRHIQQPLIEAIVEELKGGAMCVSTGESAARTNRVMEWITG